MGVVILSDHPATQISVCCLILIGLSQTAFAICKTDYLNPSFAGYLALGTRSSTQASGRSELRRAHIVAKSNAERGMAQKVEVAQQLADQMKSDALDILHGSESGRAARLLVRIKKFREEISRIADQMSDQEVYFYLNRWVANYLDQQREALLLSQRDPQLATLPGLSPGTQVNDLASLVSKHIEAMNAESSLDRIDTITRTLLTQSIGKDQLLELLGDGLFGNKEGESWEEIFEKSYELELAKNIWERFNQRIHEGTLDFLPDPKQLARFRKPGN